MTKTCASLQGTREGTDWLVEYKILYSTGLIITELNANTTLLESQKLSPFLLFFLSFFFIFLTDLCKITMLFIVFF